MNLRVVLALTGSLVFVFTTFGATTWTGAVSADWGQAANWSNGLPAPSNDAIVPAAPAGMYFPVFNSDHFLHFNIQNFGVINIGDNSSVTLSGTFVNYSNSSFVIAGAGGKITVQPGAIFENYGQVFNNGEFRSEGVFLNAATGDFGNSAVFVAAEGSSFTNHGTFNNFSELLTEADFFNTGAIHNHNFFRNGFQLKNDGQVISFFGSVFQNDFEFNNRQGAYFATAGIFTNQHFFENHGEMTTSPGAQVSNTGVAEIGAGAVWGHQGNAVNHVCAVLKNAGTLTNEGLILNEGIIFEENGIAPNPPSNQGDGIVFSSGGTTVFCENLTRVLDPVSGAVTVSAADFVDAQILTCPGWEVLVNGQPSLTFSGCGSLGPHLLNVHIVNQSGLSIACQPEITVADMEPPFFEACPAALVVNSGDCDETVPVTWALPQATDLCLAGVVSNYQPGDLLPVGATTVVYTASDQSGNTSICSFDVTVQPGMSLACPENLKVSVPVGETASPASFNFPEGITQCQICPAGGIPGFHWLGTLEGHRYFLYLGGAVSWSEADALAVAQGGYLAEISSALENRFLKNEWLPIFNAAWVGLSDAVSEGDYSWSSGAGVSFSNWATGASPQNPLLDYVVFQADGTWKDESATAKHTFILEIPCIETAITSNRPAVLDDFVFPLGNTVIFFDAEDACGHQCGCSFEVEVVQGEAVDICKLRANPANGWIESVETEGFVFQSGNDGGYGDHKAAILEMPNPGCFLKLAPGGDGGAYHYWRIWADMNADGDFFDQNETLASVEGRGVAEACFGFPGDLPPGPVQLRIAMSRYRYPSPCGDFLAGEAEDYLVKLIPLDSFLAGNCEWAFPFFQARLENLTVQLVWSGAGDCEVDTFFIDRSDDGTDFVTFHTVSASEAATAPMLFGFRDFQPASGQNFYRVRAKLAGGNEVASPVKVVEIEAGLDGFFLYPNPVSGSLFLNTRPFEGKWAEVRVADCMGRTVWELDIDELGPASSEIDASGLVAGAYFLYLKIEGKRTIFHEKFIVR